MELSRYASDCRPAARLALGLIAVLVLPATNARAHGGQFRAPPNPIPYRVDRDPIPPSPPPPPPGQPVEPGPQGGDGKKPVSVGTTRPPTPPYAWQSWVYWYDEHRAHFEDRKRVQWRSWVDPTSLFPSGAKWPRPEWQDHARNILAKRAEEMVLPALLRTARDVRAHQDLRAAAVLALAKVSHDPKHVELLRDLATGRAPSQGVVRESAACALGLLRRQASQHQLPVATIDAVRGELQGVVRDAKAPRRTRGMAALAIGLLGDQPGAAPKATTEHLLAALSGKSDNRDVDVGILVAIGLQPLASVTEAQRHALRLAVMKGTWNGQDLERPLRAHAAEALGRVGTDADIPLLHRLVRSRRTGRGALGRASIAAIGRLGARSTAADARVRAARLLLSPPSWGRGDALPQWSFMALADLVEADVRDGRTDVLTKTEVGARLMEVAANGRYQQRPHAILALARIGRAIGDATTKDVEGELHWNSRDLLRSLLSSKKLSARDRGAVAVGLGLLQDYKSAKPLVALVAQREEAPELRAYAAHALGLMGMATNPVILALRDALATGATAQVGREAVNSLALLRSRDLASRIGRQLVSVQAIEARADLVWSMGEVGREYAIEPLLRIMNDETRSVLERAVACAALGEACDVERYGSLTLLRTTRSPFDVVDLLREVRSYI